MIPKFLEPTIDYSAAFPDWFLLNSPKIFVMLPCPLSRYNPGHLLSLTPISFTPVVYCSGTRREITQIIEEGVDRLRIRSSRLDESRRSLDGGYLKQTYRSPCCRVAGWSQWSPAVHLGPALRHLDCHHLEMYSAGKTCEQGSTRLSHCSLEQKKKIYQLQFSCHFIFHQHNSSQR